MSSGKLIVHKTVNLKGCTLLMGLSGWMDSGLVSTGTIKQFIRRLEAQKFAEIDSAEYYLQSFPGSMEVTALFRPYTKIEHGLIQQLDEPTNEFFCSENNNLLLFLGTEPNLRWAEYADCIFELCSQVGVERIYFIGSVAGLVPHTREPKIFCSASDEKTRDELGHCGFKPSDYDGPASIVTYLTRKASEHKIAMAALVATVPAYVQGMNPRCIEAVIRRLSNLFGLEVELSELCEMGEEFEKKLDEAVQEHPELAENIDQLEENYDNEIFDREMGDLKKWLEQQGVRLD